MKSILKPILSMIVLLGFLIAQSPTAGAEPDYAKWGRLAMKETVKRYHANIVDYKHVGRTGEASKIPSETFRLLLDKGSHKFEVTVRIWFERDTERVVRIQFTEDGEVNGRARQYPLI
ncbi:hypothetical protein Back11_21290 [Paenibacillus baekrokdamisoli]|uniref:Uncharacterized protein n=1 Tax=Paenibacillus baekrokdamisoli TaxID=1712516 RepID=A0A3G9JBW7_9BACL|nr:DUF3889 domain-containing protein [Paenibacillus baekrokdamisoli]MBB3069862.1 hypothetical protein [Paenibacillus baekrokdamisoli]BBH20784.1 hypothetical protein Back11_21290 [Paenibacillus baekrokdamisoli]